MYVSLEDDRRGLAARVEPMVRMPARLREELIEHARQEVPNECCGVIAGRDGQLLHAHRAQNIAASPLRYEVDPREQFRLQLAIMEAGLELAAIYHSHTRAEPYPSTTDIALAWPGVLYVIVGLVPQPRVRAYRIARELVSEVALL